MDFVLKQYDDVLLAFTATRSLDGTDIFITSVNDEKVAHLPLGMEPTNESLSRWLAIRAILWYN